MQGLYLIYVFETQIINHQNTTGLWIRSFLGNSKPLILSWIKSLSRFPCRRIKVLQYSVQLSSHYSTHTQTQLPSMFELIRWSICPLTFTALDGLHETDDDILVTVSHRRKKKVREIDRNRNGAERHISLVSALACVQHHFILRWWSFHIALCVCQRQACSFHMHTVSVCLI